MLYFAQKKGRYHHYSVHFCHQALEKMLKALISERTKSVPYPTHNFKILLDQSGLKDVPEDINMFLISMIPH
ncbi:MAG: HEPN domain-containing protein [Candidatus Omnitrophica bacterium]|nr:HEPN domain-containing protein [Candidatus Omnitrophota bacterium]